MNFVNKFFCHTHSNGERLRFLFFRLFRILCALNGSSLLAAVRGVTFCFDNNTYTFQLFMWLLWNHFSSQLSSTLSV